ncbi:unnamed protein product [Parascedosporium putredinis]|uniref:Ferric oxidoreductase domain-containing protein n=1 Tax=Parascedosporium putredinis TaxID=1442378 RepID=A0A9P1M7G1_9PEZI|nr:unnamed protein product [Parascedosporium putredinis]CAI7991621.1 unnamed protein product [Parascedosporium putredinis]
MLSRLTAAVGLLATAAVPASAHTVDGRYGYGLIGYGISMYDPPCAYACRSAIAYPLECPMDHDMHGDDAAAMSSHMSMGPSAECYATNEHFLHSMAWCIHERCGGLPMSQLEEYWELNIPGRGRVQPLPRLSYQQALDEVTEAPETVVEAGETLNMTTAVTDESYWSQYNTLRAFEEIEVNHSRYGLVVLITCHLLRLRHRPPAFGTRHAVPAFGLAIIPTRGQALFILYIVVVNVVLSSVGYRATSDNAWFATPAAQIRAYVSNRLGVLSFANLPLAILYGSRNNVLLRLTNWSHNTFLLVHRWIGVLCMLQAVLHSAIYLQEFLENGTHADESKLPYWYTGIVATLALSVIVPLSILPVRRWCYEFFVSSHVVLTVVSIIGCWYHIAFRYSRQWGYETWIYMAIAIMSFDHLFRVLRMARHGVKYAYVTAVDAEYYRIDIPGVSSRGHVYMYFPTLTWRVWENHPFSVAGILGRPGADSQEPTSASGSDNEKEMTTTTKIPSTTTTTSSTGPVPTGSPAGITLYMRIQDGATSYLAARAGKGPIPVLVEGSYGRESVGLFPHSHVHADSDFPNIVCVAGGVGITAILPVLEDAQSLGRPLGSLKLFWGSRSQALVDAVSSNVASRSVGVDGRVRWGDAEVQVAIGERLSVRSILEAEINEKTVGGTTVVVCGPAAMSDEVRCTVAALGRHSGVAVRLVEESFDW